MSGPVLVFSVLQTAYLELLKLQSLMVLSVLTSHLSDVSVPY